MVGCCTAGAAIAGCDKRLLAPLDRAQGDPEGAHVPAEQEHHRLPFRRAQMDPAWHQGHVGHLETPKGTPMDSAGAVLATVALQADLRTAQTTGGDTLPSCRALTRMRARHVARANHPTAAGGAR